MTDQQIKLRLHRVTAVVEWEMTIPETEADPKSVAERTLKSLLPPNIQTKAYRLRSFGVQTGKKQALQILAEFTPEEVFSKLTNTERKVEFEKNGEKWPVRLNSHRYFVFYHNPQCVSCGVTGTKFLLEKGVNDKVPHFNFYAEENGELLLMTRDHIFAKAGGGGDHHSNYQTMCSICNNLKGSHYIPIKGIAELRKIFTNNRNVLPPKELNDLLDVARRRLAITPTPPSQIPPPTDTMVCMKADVGILESKNGNLLAVTIYDAFDVGGRDMELVASLRKGTYVRPAACQNSGFIMQFNDRMYVLPYGYTTMKRNAAKKHYSYIKEIVLH